METEILECYREKETPTLGIINGQNIETLSRDEILVELKKMCRGWCQVM